MQLLMLQRTQDALTLKNQPIVSFEEYNLLHWTNIKQNIRFRFIPYYSNYF